MSLVLNTAPAVEPISLAEAKAHLRIDSEAFEENLTTEISIAPGDHEVAAAYSLVGDWVEVSGSDVLVNLVAGQFGSGGTVDAKLQESEDGETGSDVDSGAFTQVTESNDNQVHEKAYTGAYRYIRVVATVAGATCDFGVEVVKKAGPDTEDDWLNDHIAGARRDCELFQNRAYITQTWELWLDAWPGKDYIDLPKPPLQSITSIKYYDTDDTEATFSSDSYTVDIKDQYSPIVYLKYGQSWPSTTLRPYRGICVTFVAGYGDAGSDVPQNVRAAILLVLSHLYEHREDVVIGTISSVLPKGVDNLLSKEKVY